VDAGFVSEEDAAGLKANAGEILDIVFETSAANADSTPTP
jgi:hypothetical protein